MIHTASFCDDDDDDIAGDAGFVTILPFDVLCMSEFRRLKKPKLKKEERRRKGKRKKMFQCCQFMQNFDVLYKFLLIFKKNCRFSSKFADLLKILVTELRQRMRNVDVKDGSERKMKILRKKENQK